MGNLCDHATDGWCVFALYDLVEPGEAEALDDKLVLDRGADLRTEGLQFDFGDCAGVSHDRAPMDRWTGSSLQLFHCLAAQGGDFGLVAKLDESVEGGLDDIVWVRRAQGLGEHILDASGSHDGANRLASDDARTFSGGLQHDLTGAKVTEYLVRNGRLSKVDLVQVLLRGFDPLTDGLRYLFCLTGTVANYTFAGVTNDDECSEGHILTALDDLGDAIDGDDLVLEVEPVRLDLFLHCHNVLIQLSGCRSGRLMNLRNRVQLRGLRLRELSRGAGRDSRRDQRQSF